MTDKSALLEEMQKAILAEPNRELRASMSRALLHAMNDPEPEKRIMSDATFEQAILRDMAEWRKILNLETK